MITQTERMTVTVQVLAQSDLCFATYVLDIAKDHEPDPAKQAALDRVIDGLWNITNHSGVDAIGSDVVLAANAEAV